MQAVDGVLDADVLVADDGRVQLERLLHVRIEVFLRERQLRRRHGRVFVGRDVLDGHEDRPVGVGADLEVATALALVA